MADYSVSKGREWIWRDKWKIYNPEQAGQMYVVPTNPWLLVHSFNKQQLCPSMYKTHFYIGTI